MVTFAFQKVEQPRNSGGKEVFHKKPLGRRRHLANRPLRSVRLVPLRLERSESAASVEYFLAAASPFSLSQSPITLYKQSNSLFSFYFSKGEIPARK